MQEGIDPIVQTRFLAGALGTSELACLLLSLQSAGRTGRLRLDREGVTRELYLDSGLLIAADSSSRDDSIEWMLFRAGEMTEERHAEVSALLQDGARRGPALVETGCLTPGALCAWSETRARYLASDTLSWTNGTYQFEDGPAPPGGSIHVKLNPVEILLDSIRQPSAADCLSSMLPAGDLVLEPASFLLPAAGAPAVRDLLQPHEAYVLSLADGRRRVSEICMLSEFGAAETLRTLALLRFAGCLRSGVAASPTTAPSMPSASGAPARAALEESYPAPEISLPADLPAGESTAEMRAVIRVYNDHYSFVYAHMIKEVGPIAEHLLEKHLREVRDLHAALFNRAAVGRDGCLPEDTIMRNANLVKDQNRRELLVGGMHDYLKAMVLAVRRILGPAHEVQVARRLRELRCTRI